MCTYQTTIVPVLIGFVFALLTVAQCLRLTISLVIVVCCQKYNSLHNWYQILEVGLFHLKQNIQCPCMPIVSFSLHEKQYS
jgi:hypothetical protein